MAKVELDPAKTRTVHELRVRFCETDLMGIVHHANYLAYFEAGRVEWLRRRGVDYNSWQKKGLHLPVVDVTVRYRAPAQFDDILDVETSLTEIRAATLRFEYRVLRRGLVLVEGMTRLACVDDQRGVRRFDEETLAVLVQAEQGQREERPLERQAIE